MPTHAARVPPSSMSRAVTPRTACVVPKQFFIGLHFALLGDALWCWCRVCFALLSLFALHACPTHGDTHVRHARRYVIANVNSFRTSTFLPTSLVRRQLDRVLKRLFPTRRSSAARKHLSAQQRLVTALGAWMQVAGWPRRAGDACDNDACASLSSTHLFVASSSLPAPSASVAAASVAASAVQVETVHTSLRFFSVHVPTPTPPHTLATAARAEIVKWQAQWQHVSPEVRHDGCERILSRSRWLGGLHVGWVVGLRQWTESGVGDMQGERGSREESETLLDGFGLGLMGVDVCE